MTFRDEARGALIAMAVGVAIATAAGGEKARLGSVLVNGSVVGLSIYAVVSALMHLFRDLLDRVKPWVRQVLVGALFMAGGLIGWTIGIALVQTIYGRPFRVDNVFDPRIRPILVVTCAAVLTVGLLLRSFEVMHERLRDQEWAQKELELARSIQSRLLPPPEVEGAGYSVAARNLPAHLVAGDFFDVVKLDDGSVVVVAADVAGKGIGASLIMASVKAVVPFVARLTVTEAMTQLNEKLVQELEKRQFVAMVFARYFPSERMLHFANAGFPEPYLVRNGTVTALPTTGGRLPLGIRGAMQYETRVTQLESDDRLLFVSDGIPEAPMEGDDPLGYERMADLIGRAQGQTAAAWLDSFLSLVRARVGTTLTDDWTAVVLEVR